MVRMLRERLNRILWKDFDKELYDRDYSVNLGFKFFGRWRWLFFEDRYIEENIDNSSSGSKGKKDQSISKAIGFITKKFEK